MGLHLQIQAQHGKLTQKKKNAKNLLTLGTTTGLSMKNKKWP
jgi:hypothetical protein